MTSRSKPGYWTRLWQAFCSRAVAPGGPDDVRVAEAQARVATLEMDLRERDEQIERLRREYEALRAERDRAFGQAGQSEMEKLFRRLCGPLSNLDALATLAEAGKDVQARDMAGLVRSLEKELARAGLEPVGRVGETGRFDVRFHQRMSGGTVHDGTPVTVRLPGYRLGEKVLQKAMVSAKEE